MSCKAKKQREMKSHTLAFDAFAGSGFEAGDNMNVKGRVTTTHHILSTLLGFKSSVSHRPTEMCITLTDQLAQQLPMLLQEINDTESH